MDTKLPEFLREYFWDVKFEELDKDTNAKFIINRLLNKGGLKETKWVEKSYSPEIIKEVLRTDRDFSLRNGSFWGLIFNVPQSQIRCFYEPFRTMRKQRWQY